MPMPYQDGALRDRVLSRLSYVPIWVIPNLPSSNTEPNTKCNFSSKLNRQNQDSNSADLVPVLDVLEVAWNQIVHLNRDRSPIYSGCALPGEAA